MLSKNSDGRWEDTMSSVSVGEEDAFYISKLREDVFDKESAGSYISSIHSLKVSLNNLEKAEAGILDKYDGKLFLLTPSKIKSMRLDERDNWSHGFDELRKDIIGFATDHKDDITAYSGSAHEHCYQVGNIHTTRPNILREIAKLCKTENGITQLAKRLYPVVSVDTDSLEKIKQFAKRLDIWLQISETLELNSSSELDNDEQYDIMVETYPMLRFVSSGYHEEQDYRTVANYIDSMEE
jgi:hypothetical protein